MSLLIWPKMVLYLYIALCTFSSDFGDNPASIIFQANSCTSIFLIFLYVTSLVFGTVSEDWVLYLLHSYSISMLRRSILTLFYHQLWLWWNPWRGQGYGFDLQNAGQSERRQKMRILCVRVFMVIQVNIEVS